MQSGDGLELREHLTFLYISAFHTNGIVTACIINRVDMERTIGLKVRALQNSLVKICFRMFESVSGPILSLFASS